MFNNLPQLPGERKASQQEDQNGFTTALRAAPTTAEDRETAEILSLQAQWLFSQSTVEGLSEEAALLDGMKLFLFCCHAAPLTKKIMFLACDKLSVEV